LARFSIHPAYLTVMVHKKRRSASDAKGILPFPPKKSTPHFHFLLHSCIIKSEVLYFSVLLQYLKPYNYSSVLPMTLLSVGLCIILSLFSFSD